MHAEWAMVTPEIAEQWLGKIETQRNLSKFTVVQYAEDMKNGRWTEDMTFIAFDENGHLANGQHRLHAVIASGCTIGFWVRWDVATDAILRTDQGKGRRSSDQLMIQGVVATTQTAAIANQVLKFERFPERVWTALSAITRSLTVDEVLAHREEYHAATLEASRITNAIKSNRSTFGALSIIVSRYSPSDDRWPGFVETLISGANLPYDDVRLAIRNYWIRREGRVWGSGQADLLAMLNAWNKYVKGESLQVLQIPRRKQLPMPKPL